MSAISAVSAAPPLHAAAQARPKSGKADGDGDHGVEPAAQQAQAAASARPGGVNLTA
ncbi:MAG: hypothetical protein ACP5NP_16535 [Acetobacteraceae bacterium]